MSARLTVAQALVRFLAVQEIERDGERSRFFAGALGIFGHGNVAGIGQALAQYPGALPFHPARNEQAMVHIASGYARQRNRLALSWAEVGKWRRSHRNANLNPSWERARPLSHRIGRLSMQEFALHSSRQLGVMWSAIPATM